MVVHGDKLGWATVHIPLLTLKIEHARQTTAGNWHFMRYTQQLGRCGKPAAEEWWALAWPRRMVRREWLGRNKVWLQPGDIWWNAEVAVKKIPAEEIKPDGVRCIIQQQIEDKEESLKVLWVQSMSWVVSQPYSLLTIHYSIIHHSTTSPLNSNASGAIEKFIKSCLLMVTFIYHLRAPRFSFLLFSSLWERLMTCVMLQGPWQWLVLNHWRYLTHIARHLGIFIPDIECSFTPSFKLQVHG